MLSAGVSTMVQLDSVNWPTMWPPQTRWVGENSECLRCFLRGEVRLFQIWRILNYLWEQHMKAGKERRQNLTRTSLCLTLQVTGHPWGGGSDSYVTSLESVPEQLTVNLLSWTLIRKDDVKPVLNCCFLSTLWSFVMNWIQFQQWEIMEKVKGLYWFRDNIGWGDRLM